MSKETFKAFARNHPELATSVLKNNTTWQKLYEIYEIYGESSNIWNTYITPSTAASSLRTTSTSTSASTSFKDLFNTFKNIDLNSVQKGVENLQKTIGILQDMGFTNTKGVQKLYEPRPIYKHFED